LTEYIETLEKILAIVGLAVIGYWIFQKSPPDGRPLDEPRDEPRDEPLDEQP